MENAANGPQARGQLLEDRIVQLMQKGDKQFLDLLYQKYGGIMLKIVMSITQSREAAEDVIQDGLVKIWKNAHTYDPSKAKLLTWVVQIAKNTALDLVRSKAMKKANVTDTMADRPDASNYGTVSQNEDSIGIRETIDKNIEPRDKAILELLYFQGYTQKEVAQELEMPVGSVKTRVRITVNRLRTLLTNAS